jgi:hypothetical protein
MLKKLTVLAMAVGVVAALALPASASATWKHHATAIQQSVQVGFTGQARFQGGLGGVECQVTSAAQFLAGQTTGNITSFTPHPTNDTTNCKGLGGLAFCQIHNVAPTTFPWVFHTVQSPVSVSVTHGQIHSQATGGFCPVNTLTITAGTVTITPNQPNTASSVTLSGSASVHLTTNNGQVDTENTTVSGSLAIEAPNAATYSI